MLFRSDTGYYLQLVLSGQRDWDNAARVAGDTARCFDKEEATLLGESERFRTAANLTAERRDRQIAKREQQIATNAQRADARQRLVQRRSRELQP